MILQWSIRGDDEIIAAGSRRLREVIAAPHAYNEALSVADAIERALLSIAGVDITTPTPSPAWPGGGRARLTENDYVARCMAEGGFVRAEIGADGWRVLVGPEMAP